MTTPLCNTGVHPPLGVPAFSQESRFDWYRATVPTSVSILTKACMEIAGPYSRVVEGKGRFNYLRSTSIEDAGGRVATILHGGSNGDPNVEASGERAPALARLLRDGGEHRVTRCDVAVDLYGDDLFDRLREACIDISDEYRIKTREVGSPNDDDAGKTFYLGSRKSSVFARVYEKGKADRKHYRDYPDDVLAPWVRIELEVKPDKEMKAKAAGIQPSQFWGISAWATALSEKALDMSPEPISFHPRRTATDEAAFRHMCDQYRNLLHRRSEQLHGGDTSLLAQEIVDRVFGAEPIEDAA